nr:hypothetical protein [Kofleriaceae bacterium]
MFVPLVLGNLLGFASVVAYSATPSADADAPIAVAAPAAAAAAAPLLPPAKLQQPQAPDAPEVRAGAELPAQWELDPSHFSFVVDIDGDAYMQLRPLDEEHLPRHGRARRAASESQSGQSIAFAPVATAALDDAERSWLGKLIVVDGTCRARIDRFAIRGGLSGETVDQMSAGELLAQGEPTLVAHLDACRGGKTARDASLAPADAAVLDTAAPDAASLRALAEHDLWASEPGRADRRVYDDSRGQPDPHEIETASTVVVHPRTHDRFVIVHARLVGEACSSDASFELGAIYRVTPGGDLVRVYIGDTSPIDLAQPIVDLDGDGEFEVVGDHDVTSLRGDTLATRRGDNFLGCPC